MRRKIREKGELKRTRERKEKELEVQAHGFCALQNVIKIHEFILFYSI